MKKKMHLCAFLQNGLMNHVPLMWAHPRDKVGYDFTKPEYWQDLGRILERGKFDAMFLADVLAPYDVYKGSIETTVKYGVQFPVHDPMLLVPIVAMSTQKLGFGITISTSFEKPYLVSRRLATLDHLTNGRIGWNVVTSYSQNEFKVLGHKEMVPHDERYDKAEEFLDLCFKLWNSWDPDAVLMDKKTGIFADPQKIHPINFQGKYYESTGPLSVMPSPQGHPVIWQAGASSRGRDFAAKYAESIFTIQPSVNAMKQYSDDMRKRANKLGRNPDDIKILFGIQVIIGETEEAAKAKQKAIMDLIPLEAALTLMSGHIGYDFSKVDLNQLFEYIEVNGIQNYVNVYSKMQDTPLTVGEAAKIHGLSGGSPVLVGTPEQVADQLEFLFHEGGGNGFNIRATYAPGCYEEFVELVVPILQKRGLFRTDYQGNTLREHLMEY
jgi:long-chain alkane monooxygenase